MFSFFRKKEKPLPPTYDLTALINRRAGDFRAFYEERFGNKLNYQFNSLYLINTVLEETRMNAPALERKQWLAAHAGAYLYRTASLRIYHFRYQWYHPLDQPMMVVDANDCRITLLAQQAIQQRMDAAIEPGIVQLYTNFEQAVLFAKPGDDLLFV